MTNTWVFEYTGSEQTIELPRGVYFLECWGAQGRRGISSNYVGGLGGYAWGILTLSETTMLRVYVGQGGDQSRLGGWNGGGTSAAASFYGGGGGGATDIRLNTTLESRILVAGGGGGATRYVDGGGGGGLDGLPGTNYGAGIGGSGGTQTAGGVDGGAFGLGGNAAATRGAGGGGWYGGGAGHTGNYASGAGGSSYLSNLAYSGTLANVRTGNGYARIRKLHTSESLLFDYVGAEQVIPLLPGSYQIECWGAQGGSAEGGGAGGLGGYARGIIILTEPTDLHLRVGQQPSSHIGGWNGGGSGAGYLSEDRGGGGATDIRLRLDKNQQWITAGGVYSLYPIEPYPAYESLDLTTAYDSDPDTYAEVVISSHSGEPEDATWLYVGHEAPFDQIECLFHEGAVNTQNAVLEGQYFNGTAWVGLSIIDGTALNGRTWAQDGVISFVRPSNWVPYHAIVEKGNWYWIRLRVAYEDEQVFTDTVRLAEVNVYAYDLGNGLRNRILVAGGGGGTIPHGNGWGGAGGGETGGDGTGSSPGAGGTQTAGGQLGGAWGIGGSHEWTTSFRSGGGGGWYGGGASYGVLSGGGGGSSYIGGAVETQGESFPLFPIAQGYTEAGVRDGHGQIVITPIVASTRRPRAFAVIVG